MKRTFRIALLAAFAAAHALPALADTGSEMMSMLESMKRQMSQMQATIDAQNSRIRDLETRMIAERPALESQIPAPRSQALTENDRQKGIKENIGDAVPFLKGAKYGGDLRLRMENFEYFEKNNDAGSTGTSADRARNRFRIRLRWGFEKDYGDDWKIGFRLATGNTTDNTSTNVTLGNPQSYFSNKPINIDRAFAQYSPNGLKDYGPLKGVTVGAGKFDNPFLRYSTPIVWDGDVTPEGIYEKADFSLLSEEENKLNLHMTAGQFITAENAGNETDAQIFGYQGVLAWTTYLLNGDHATDLHVAASYYDYPNWFQTVSASGNANATSYLRTNTSALDDPRILDVYPELSFYVGEMPMTTWYNYVKNVGEIDATRAAIGGVHSDDEAWGVGFKVNKAKKKGDWEAFYGYYEIAPNAVVAAFNDSDFGGPGTNGYTNRVGHKFGMTYFMTDAIQLNWTGYLVRPLHVSTIPANSTSEEVFRSQMDLVYKF